MTDRLPNWVKPGVSFRQERHPNLGDILHHVRGVVDDHAVVRKWRPSKRLWRYEVLDADWFAAFADHLTVIRRGAA